MKKRDGVEFGGLARRKELGWSQVCKLQGRGGEKAATSNNVSFLNSPERSEVLLEMLGTP